MKTLEDMKEYFKKDRYVQLSGIEIIEVNDKYAVCKAELSDKHLNTADMVQGGMLFTLCDFAFAVISNYNHPDTVSQTGFISFINACVGAKYITATAREMTKTRHNCVGEVTVHDDKGKVICISQFNGFIR